MNCRQFEIARNTVINFVVNRSSFSLEELQNKILELGGVFLVSPGQTLDIYLKSFEKNGLIKYLPKTQSYEVLAS